MPRFGQSTTGRRHIYPRDGLAFDPFTDIYDEFSRRPSQLQNDNDLRIPISPLEKPRLGAETRRQLRAELFGPTQESNAQQESIYNATSPITPGRHGSALIRRNTSVPPPKSTTPIDIHAAFAILKELKKTATKEELVALHRALLPEITPLKPPQPESFVQYVEAVPPQNAEMRRRRSLFKPGEATRSEIAGRSAPICNNLQVAHLKGRKSYPVGEFDSLSALDIPRPCTARTATPSDLGRTYLGNYKLGSLHITNGAASPLPISRLKHVRNSSNATSEKEDEYYTASEGSAGRLEEVFGLQCNDELAATHGACEPSFSSCYDQPSTYELGNTHQDVEMQHNMMNYHNRPVLQRRHTDDTIASTGSKYSYTSKDAMDQSSIEITSFQHQEFESVLPYLPIVQNQQPQLPPSRTEWVEDIESYFIENSTMLDRTVSKSLPKTTEETPSYDFLPVQSDTAQRQIPMLQLSDQKQDIERDSAYGSDSHLLQSSRDDEHHGISIEALQVQRKESRSQSRSARERRILDNRIANSDAASAKPAAESLSCETLPRPNTNSADWTEHEVLLKPPNPRIADTAAVLVTSKPSPRKLQKKHPMPQRAVSSPIVVQGQRNLGECPYLPEDIISKHSQRLDRSPGTDHLARTYKSVVHSGSRDSLLGSDAFEPFEIRFPSPTPDSEITSRGRRAQRSGCGPFSSTGGFFRSKSRKRTSLVDSISSVECEAVPISITEHMAVPASASAPRPAPVPTPASAPIPDSAPIPEPTPAPASSTSYAVVTPLSGKRRIPSGPRAMLASSRIPTLGTSERPVHGTSEVVASELARTRSPDRPVYHDRKRSKPENILPDQLHNSAGEPWQYDGNNTTTPESAKTKTISMIDRPRGSYYGGWLRGSGSADASPCARSSGSPSPRDRRRRTRETDASQSQLDNNLNEMELHDDNDVQMSTANFTPSPRRMPPPPPEAKLLTPHKSRVTIRPVDSSSEQCSEDSLPRMQCNPVRISVSILKPPFASSSSPPTRAPPPPPAQV